jgi:hypothetical protein
VNRRWLCCLTQHELACMDQIVAQRFANSLRPSRADAVRLALVEQAANTQVPSLRRRLHAVVLEVQEHSSQHRPGAKRKDKRSRLPIVSSDPMVARFKRPMVSSPGPRRYASLYALPWLC